MVSNAGNGAAVTVTNYGAIDLYGERSRGIVAQSIGGGGGDGGSSGGWVSVGGSGDGGGTGGAVTSNAPTLTTFKEFKRFAVKVIFKTGNTSNTPKIRNLRAIALQA